MLEKQFSGRAALTANKDVVETVSVIAQVASFKLTGKRVIRMSPLHNHFIVAGWRETPLALWFWTGSLVAAVLALVLARPGPGA